jgi:hydrogenase expression/formation protein HypC
MCLGIPGRVVAITDRDKRIGLVEVAGALRETNLSCVCGPQPEALLGEWVLLHLGFAMGRIERGEAERTLALLEELGRAQAAPAAAGEPLPQTG